MDTMDMSFWSLEIPPGGMCNLYEIEQTPNTMQIVHVTNAALPPNNPAGPHCLTIKKAGKKAAQITLCTLNKDTHPQHNLDFILDETVEFRNFGKGPIHLAGYETFSGDGGEDESEEEGPSSDDEEAPQGVRLDQLGQANGTAPRKGGVPKASGSARQMQPQENAEDDEDDDESDDEDYEGDAEGSTENGMEEGSEDVSEEEGGDEEDEDDDEESSSEDEQMQQQLQAKVGSKRPAPTPAASAPSNKKQLQQHQKPMTTAPKKAKQPKQAKQAPNSDPAKQQKKQQTPKQQTPGKATPANEQEYHTAVVKFLKTQPNKTAPMAKLGTAVARPSGMMKLGPWTKSKPDFFKVDKNGQNVTLLK